MVSKRTDELTDGFGQILVAARNVGTQTLRKIIDGNWKPKSPTEEEAAVLHMIEQLGDQAPELLSLVRYTSDLAFHKLLTSLEMGEAGTQFTLTIRDVATGDEQVLVDDGEDRDLRGAWFDWVAKYGE
ncbi:MAG: hypothetical protein AB7I09_11245 [Planctomycetota bacterium]